MPTLGGKIGQLNKRVVATSTGIIQGSSRAQGAATVTCRMSRSSCSVPQGGVLGDADGHCSRHGLVDDSPGGRFPRGTIPQGDDSPGGRFPRGRFPRG